LARLLGLWGPDASYRIAQKLPELPAEEVGLDHLESLGVSRRLDLGAAHEEAQAVSHALAMATNYRWLGATSVGAGVERAPEGFTVAGPNVGVELPIFDQKRAVIARLEGQLRAALAREMALAVDVRSEVRSARSRLVATRVVVERYAKVVVPLRKRVVTLTLEQYDAMLAGVYQLLQAKQNEVTAYREFIEALRDYWLARADLERATGGSLPPAPPHAEANPPPKEGASS
jgi:cobalt-zinc-cadmium efflux system outer membrane protein